MANALDMVAGVGQFGFDPIGDFVEGRKARNYLDELKRTDKARALSGEALTGNGNSLRQLAGVDPQSFVNISKFQTESADAKAEKIASALYAADSPEKWSRTIAYLKQTGHEIGPEEENFANRDAVLGEYATLKEQQAQSNADRSYGLQERGFNADENYRAQQIDLERQKLALKDPDLVEIYDDKTGQPFKARYNPQTGGYDRVGGVKAPSGTSLEVGPNGEVTFQQGMGKPLTEAQSKDTVFFTRASGALQNLEQSADALTSLSERLGGQLPVAGNYLKSPEYQKAEQSGKEFLQAILRKDTGAAITKEETAEYGSVYLPQPGDSSAVLRQKAVSRRRALQALKLGLPPKAINEIVKAGVDLSAADNPERAPGGQGIGKSDRGNGTTRSGNQFRLVQ